ncbi:hypothetical protein [Acanthopleuribacter pedis]|uniref:Uncharacterized protein n=1 Tax=Acanthopleuribacter pedis TaxID=442870 RepID=A0A8J7U2K7_9BACT|nr:hypothetical protein [Acanthopleuribacter pedis]MBO1317353.1 hypothetical protein [Acanthopleuribacter pedis]MBO1318660.1 hypothetical protein [Acanthopleuribacter pedis]
MGLADKNNIDEMAGLMIFSFERDFDVEGWTIDIQIKVEGDESINKVSVKYGNKELLRQSYPLGKVYWRGDFDQVGRRRTSPSPQFSQGFVARSRKPCEYEDYDRETAQA